MTLYELSNIYYNNLFCNQLLSWFPTVTLKLNRHYEQTPSTGLIQIKKVWPDNPPLHPSQNTINNCSYNSRQKKGFCPNNDSYPKCD